MSKHRPIANCIRTFYKIFGHKKCRVWTQDISQTVSFFRALLFGGLRESSQHEIELKDTNVAAFKLLLRYIYTGRISLTNIKDESVLDVLGLAHKYGFVELESALSEYLKAILNSKNVCTIFGASHLFCLSQLTQFCLEYADRNAADILETESFLHLNNVS